MSTESRQRPFRRTRGSCAPPAVALPALLLCAVPAPAQQQPDTAAVRLPRLVVDVTRLGVGGVPLTRVPFGAQVITPEQQTSTPGATLGDMLATLTGVSTADVMGAGLQPDITLRGFGLSPVIGLPQGLSVFVDGVRVNEPDASQVHFALIPLHAAARIEVLRGPSGPFGKNALGGAINVVTRAADEPRLEAEALLGSTGSVEARVLGATALGRSRLLGAARLLHDSGWRDAAHARLAQLFTRADWSGRVGRAFVTYTFARDIILQAGSLPLSWLEHADSVAPRWRGAADRRTINFTGGDYFGPRLHFLTAAAGRQTRLGTFELRAFHRRTDIDQFNANFTEPDTEVRTANRSTGAIAQLTLSGARHTTFGAEYTLNDVGILIFEHRNDTHPEIPPAGVMTEDVGTREHNVGLFAQMRYDVTGRLALTGMARFDYVSLPFRDNLDPANDGDNEFRQLTASAGIDWEAAARFVLFASAGRGFRAPTLMELACADPEDPCPLPYELGADPPLDPVVADTWQAGLRWFGPRELFIEAIGFLSAVRQDIFNVQAPASRAGYFTNLERPRRTGIELTAAAAPAPWLTLHTGLALTRATFRTSATLSAPYLDDDDEDADDGDVADDDDLALDPPRVQRGSSFAMVPRTRWSVEAAARRGRFTAALRADYTGHQWLRGDEDNSEPGLRIGGHALVTARAGVHLGRARLTLGAHNLLDHEHLTYGVLALNQLNEHRRIEPFVTPGRPRELFARVQYTFH